jgi:hypothetical protein
MTKRLPNTQQAINIITAATYKPLGMSDWKKFTALPADMQAHLLCEAYLATLRDRSLPGKKVGVAVSPPKQAIVFGFERTVEALEAANKLHPLLEMPTTLNKPPYTRRPKLLQALRVFHMGTSYILHLDPARYDAESQEHLRKVASSVASNIAPHWFTTEMRSDGWVTIRKKTQKELRRELNRELNKARPTSRPVGSRSMPRTTSALLRAELEAFFKSSVPRITFEPSYYDILTGHILRDRVSVLASVVAKGTYTTKITSDDIVVLEKKGQVVAPVAPVLPVVEPDEYSYRNLRDDVKNFFTQNKWSDQHFFTYDYDNCHNLPDGIFRDKVSSLAHSIAPGKYTTKIADLYGNVILTKKA